MRKLLLGAVILFGGAFSVVLFLTGQHSRSTSAPAPARAIAVPIEAIKAQARELTHEQLARFPDQYVGAVVVLRGKVVQVMEDGADLGMRVDITPDPSKLFWRDTVLVTYRKISMSEARILDADIVRMWGRFAGITSYKAIFGQTISLPLINASAVEPAPDQGSPPSARK